MAWSYSALKEFESCKRRYHELRVLKNYKQDPTEQTLYGERLHKAAELYIKSATPLPGEFQFMQGFLDALANKPGKKYTELKMALRADLTPCEWFAKDVWVRGIADLLILDEESDTAWVLDYKSGSNKYPDKEQLNLMSLMIFAHYPKVQIVRSALAFVVKEDFIKHKLEKHETDKLWWDYRERTAAIEAAHSTGVWNPTQNGLCKKYCPVLTCEHNGRS
jgi:hypothetical protein